MVVPSLHTRPRDVPHGLVEVDLRPDSIRRLREARSSQHDKNKNVLNNLGRRRRPYDLECRPQLRVRNTRAMRGLPSHGGKQIQELVCRIVRAVLEHDSVPEQNVEPLTHDVPGGATPLPVRLNDAGDILDGDAVNRGIAHRREHVIFEIPQPTCLSLEPAPRGLPQVDNPREELPDGRRALLPAMRQRVDAQTSEAQILQNRLTSLVKRDSWERAETNVPSDAVDDDAVDERPGAAGTNVQVQSEPIAVPTWTGVVAIALGKLEILPVPTSSQWVPPCSGRDPDHSLSLTELAPKGDNPVWRA